MTDRSSIDARPAHELLEIVLVAGDGHDGSDLPPGFLRVDEAECLAALAFGQVVLELGSFLGRSTVAMARSAALVVAIDHHRGSPEHQPGAVHHVTGTCTTADPSQVDTTARFLANLALYGVRDRVVPIIAPAAVVLDLLSDRTFDLAFIDGAHDFAAVTMDGLCAAALVKEGGAIVFHDATDPAFPDVARAIEQIAELLRSTPVPLAGSLVAIPIRSRRVYPNTRPA